MSEIKVKIYYSVRRSTRITSFTVLVEDEKSENTSVGTQISLKKCLLSICASSPDIICKDHDLAVYTANFQEPDTQDKSVIWEGHGLLSWATEKETLVYGRKNSKDLSSLEVFMDLQPTAKWDKEQFFSALMTGSMTQVKSCMISPPLYTTCDCYSQQQRPFETEKKSTDPLPSLPSLSSVPGLYPGAYTPPSGICYQSSKESDICFLSISPDTRRSSFVPLLEKDRSYSSGSPELVNEAEHNHSKKRKAELTTAASYPKQVSKTVRAYYEVKKNNDGNYVLPAEVDSWTVIDLGTVIYDRPAYHNQRYIYPVNYTVRKWYRSMVDPKSDTQYTCRILENGNEPLFEVTADDCPVAYSGPTPTTVWTIVVRRAFAIRDQEYGHNPVGPDFFGLRKSTISKMIQDLPNANKCSQYTWQTFELAKTNKPGRSRHRAAADIMGGVNYGLTGNRITNNIPTQYASRYERR
ncbi:F/Y-rich N-terminus-domain-containing protein [Sporodiniella umbellata]|nr:F/Y-rich N-terminus-domain-containing protein [Sporodiniella umbellata]